jgi:hypothetical protein
MSDRLMDAAAIGQHFGRDARYGRRLVEDWPGKAFLVRGRGYIREADFLEWIEGRRIETRRAEPASLKAMVRRIADDVLARRAS